jgi:serine/threonine protein kinase
MNYCHSHKLIHRDLKLENILLANSKERLVKIVDFGIAGMAINMNVEKMNVGSLKYMAPEILSGLSRSIGPAIDVWALGIILYVLVCGELPFSGKG